jgi:hypothetical protein
VTRLERDFEVRLDRDRVWAHVARVEAWPSWARHIRRVVLEPVGELTPETAGAVHLAGGIRSTFRMETLDPPSRWLWVGKFLWSTVRYDHRFEDLGATLTRVRFVVDVEGPGAESLGRLFATLYARNLDRAIPNLVGELEALGA